MVKIYMFEFTPCTFLFDCRQESSLDSPTPVLLSFNGHDKLKLFNFFWNKEMFVTNKFDLKLLNL